MSQISISRLRKIIANADAAFAASRQASEDFRNARAAVRAIEAEISPRSSVADYQSLDWDLIPQSEWPKEYAQARAVLAAAEDTVERQSAATQHAGRMRTCAITYMRENNTVLPADLQGRF